MRRISIYDGQGWQQALDDGFTVWLRDGEEYVWFKRIKDIRVD